MTFFTRKYFVFLKSLGKTLSLKIAVSLFSAIILCGSGAYSQNAPIRVSGQVTDVATGETLGGATVTVQGATTASTTDGAGKFSIGVPSANSVLVITYAGFTELKVPLEGKTVLDIKLSKVTKNLDE